MIRVWMIHLTQTPWMTFTSSWFGMVCTWLKIMLARFMVSSSASIPDPQVMRCGKCSCVARSWKCRASSCNGCLPAVFRSCLEDFMPEQLNNVCVFEENQYEPIRTNDKKTDPIVLIRFDVHWSRGKPSIAFFAKVFKESDPSKLPLSRPAAFRIDGDFGGFDGCVTD